MGLQQAIKKALEKENSKTLAYEPQAQVLLKLGTDIPLRFIFHMTPMGKPRMTQRDRWYTNPNHPDPKKRQREVIQRYNIYKRDLRTLADVNHFNPALVLYNYYHLIFYLPMPDSWSTAKKATMHGQLHRSKPDKDNLEKAFLDCLCEDDSFVADSRVTKYWCNKGEERLEVVIE